MPRDAPITRQVLGGDVDRDMYSTGLKIVNERKREIELRRKTRDCLIKVGEMITQL